MTDLSEYNCPSCGADSNHKSIVKVLKAEIAELEKEQAIRDLEQQAKGFDYASNKLTEQQGDSAAPILEMFDYFKKDLLQQAKALEEQGE